jgi:hypothetical protein
LIFIVATETFGLMLSNSTQMRIVCFERIDFAHANFSCSIVFGFERSVLNDSLMCSCIYCIDKVGLHGTGGPRHD